MSEQLQPLRPHHEFLITKEYWRFVEFCDACRRHQYIGLCHGLPGVGKTLSARYYARADLDQPLLPYALTAESPLAAEGAPATILYTAQVANSPRQTIREIARLRTMRSACLPVLARATPERRGLADPTELVIVDEADRLKVTSLEQLRDFYDRRSVGLILIGMPGIEKRMVRYPQLYSRVGFVHVIRPLEADELRAVLDRKWDQWGIGQTSDTVTTEAKAAIIRITQGNFRLLQRLFEQIGRILALNDLHAIRPEVVEAARERLIIGKS